MQDFSWQNAVEEALSLYNDVQALQHAALGQLVAARQYLPVPSPNLTEGQRQALAVRRLLEEGIEALRAQDGELARVLDLHFLQNKSVTALETILTYGRTTIYDRRNRGIAALISILVQCEAEAADWAASRQQAVLGALPLPTYERWVGGEAEIARLYGWLEQGLKGPGAPLVITGIGGIGKTSLTREALATWFKAEDPAVDRLLWTVVVQPTFTLNPQLRNRRQRFTLDQVLSDLGAQLDAPVNALPSNERRLQLLARSLRDTASIVVIDNVETPDEADMALTLVNALASVAQIVITSRHQIDPPHGHTLTLGELSQDDALLLLQWEAQRLQLGDIDGNIRQGIVDLVGGNPHALKLAVAQLGQIPPEQLLRGFRSHSLTAQVLYDHIYAQAWDLLSAEAQDLLLSLWLLPPTGATWEGLKELREMNGSVTDEELANTVGELVALNLLQTTPASPHTYSLHRLTYSFLARQIGLAGGSPDGV